VVHIIGIQNTTSVHNVRRRGHSTLNRNIYIRNNDHYLTAFSNRHSETETLHATSSGFPNEHKAIMLIVADAFDKIRIVEREKARTELTVARALQ
jgi:hypothetical protein